MSVEEKSTIGGLQHRDKMAFAAKRIQFRYIAKTLLSKAVKKFIIHFKFWMCYQ